MKSFLQYINEDQSAGGNGWVVIEYEDQWHENISMVYGVFHNETEAKTWAGKRKGVYDVHYIISPQ
jgi:hypothetical protein